MDESGTSKSIVVKDEIGFPLSGLFNALIV
jgi:hypothetical protein